MSELNRKIDSMLLEGNCDENEIGDESGTGTNCLKAYRVASQSFIVL